MIGNFYEIDSVEQLSHRVIKVVVKCREGVLPDFTRYLVVGGMDGQIITADTELVEAVTEARVSI